jgi:glycosyltransferase involved in cell wall biosynthesis
VAGHSCVCSWFQEVRDAAPGPEWNVYRHSVERGLRGADLVVAPTRTMLGWLNRWYGPLPRTRVIANGIRPEAFDAQKERECWILCAGRMWDEGKNVRAVAESAPEFHWPVILAGLPDPEHETVAPLNVEFRMNVERDELARIYSRAGLYLLPARYEPFGLTPLEAALSGCPLVLGDIPTLREVWGDAAEYVSPNDRRQLVATVNHLIAAPDRRAALAERGLKRAMELTSARMAAEYYREYRSLIAAQQRRTHRREAPSAGLLLETA